MKNQNVSKDLFAVARAGLDFLSALLRVLGSDRREGSTEPRRGGQALFAPFTAKEAEFRRALNSYSFKRDALMQSIGMGGQVIGEYHRVSTFHV